MANEKKKKSILSLLFWAVAISVVITIALTPVMKAIYPLTYRQEIEEAAKKFGISETLVMGIISTESNFDVSAISHKDAYGLMQIKDETALWCIDNLSLNIDKEDIREPEANIIIGCAYIDYLTELYDGNTKTAVAAYNAGLGNVNKWLADKRYSDGTATLKEIPFPETKAYVEKVSKRQEIYKKLYY
jgi:soluble lytic murein transglycosylase